MSLTRLETLQTLQMGLSGGCSAGFSGGFSALFSTVLSGILSDGFFFCLKTERQNWPQKLMKVLLSPGMVIMSLG